jgi:ribonucleoside-diphosphate reductase alpha chain
MHVDDSACNLSSLNLMKFRRPDGSFDVRSFEHCVDVMLLAQEIIVGRRATPPRRSASTPGLPPARPGLRRTSART